ncbi:MAG: hypothetical protein JSV19_05490 [Phycisphaerales bacterium]|nr:MAG: hypothetical protein JSV19_05490 [Phycisphaerales bacterium]
MRLVATTRTTNSWAIATVLEIILVVGVLALAITIVSGLYTHALDRVKTRQATVLIATLDQAVRAYADACGSYPRGSPDASLRRVLPALLSIPESKRRLAALSPALLFVVDGQPRCHDPWGQQLRCLTDRVAAPASARRVENNDRVPVFESGGPDRDFGDNDPARRADNIRSDEPLDLPSDGYDDGMTTTPTGPGASRPASSPTRSVPGRGSSQPGS